MSEGMAKAKEIYESRSKRAVELKSEGKKIIGYFCCYPPAELLTALDLVPFRITGSVNEPMNQVDSYLETIMCPYIRSSFDLALKGNYDFLDGLVVPHTCDNVERIYDIWRYYLKPGYSHFINVPHMMNAGSVEFYKNELEVYQKSLEEFAGKKITPQSLADAIQLHNENRALLRELYELRKSDPPLLSGVEVIEVVVAGMCIPVREHNELLKQVISEVKARPQSQGKTPRIMAYGSEIDDIAFIDLIESCGAKVVMDDLCTTTRQFWHVVETTDDPLGAVAERYLTKIVCPRTYIPRDATHLDDLENRFGYLKQYAQDYDVNGVILYIIRFCDTHEFDVPDVIEYLQSLGLPVLNIEDDYRVSNVGQLRTRIEAFLEIIS